MLVLSCLILTIPCTAETITVDDDGPADFDNIQDAVDYSWHGDTIIVRPGTYSSVNFNGRAITLSSNNPDDPNIVESTTAGDITFEFLEDSDSVITGLTVTGIFCNASSPIITKNIISNGSGISGQYTAAPTISHNLIDSNDSRGIFDCHGTISYNTISNNYSGSGGGLYACHGTISNNIITNNTGSLSGGGLSFCNGTISNNTIAYNTTESSGGGSGGGGLIGCSGEIVDNEIRGNSSSRSGGGLADCNGSIRGNIIAENETTGNGGGLHACAATISNNIISANRSAFGGGGLQGCQGTVFGNVISGNEAPTGGGLSSSNGEIYNNTIVGNRASNGGGGALHVCNGPIRNNIIAYNSSAISSSYGNSYNIFWNNDGINFEGGATAGLGDIAVNPVFAVAGYWDDNGTPADESDDSWVDGEYYVKSEYGRWNPDAETWVIDTVTSRCIDAGDPADDILQEPNPNGAIINVGAYGGTIYASKSPHGGGPEPVPECVNRPSKDYNNDCKVDLADFAEFLSEWLACGLDIQAACWE